MGNTPSNLSTQETEDSWWNNEKNMETPTAVVIEDKSDINEFSSEEFDRKRAKRKLILDAKRQEIQQIREELASLRQENSSLRKNSAHIPRDQHDVMETLRKENEKLKEELSQMKSKEEQLDNLMEKNKELRISVSEMQSELQVLNSTVLDFEQQKQDYKKHVLALKDVIKVSKELIMIRENELKELKEKMKRIELEFNEREASLMSTELRREYERQLANIRILRDLYEERSRTHRRETAILKSNISEKDQEIEKNEQKISELMERVNQLENENSEKYDKVKLLESNLGLAKAETRQCEAELSVINQLFSNILLAFNNSPDLDLDKLLKQLEANHGLLKDIVNNEISGEISSALPKVLLDLVNQISSERDESAPEETSEAKKPTSAVDGNEVISTSQHSLNSPAEIVENLPKVWKVLIELLSHQASTNSEQEDGEDTNLCFKTVSTPKGPSLVLSVSKTFFRLKELIVEKRALEKDMNNLKQLNSHLENRLQEQEKRFGFVSIELTKTWSFVEKLQKEHHLLHTQEQLLRYELAQKRKLLKELKEELQYSREKWQQAREKNSKTEKEWLILRKEFAARRKTIVNDDGNNSVESGYSDEREESSEEDPDYETDISECNLKSEDTCENEDLTCNTEEDNTERLCHKAEDEVIKEHNQTDETDNEPGSSSHDNSNTSILDVIQNEIEEIAKEIPTHSTLNNDTVSSDDVQKTENNEIPKLENNDKTIEESPNGHSSGTSSTSVSLEERLAARDERLKRLEGQCKALVSQVTTTSHKSAAIYNKLESLHEIYGESSRNTQINEQAEPCENTEVSDAEADGSENTNT